MTTLLAARRQDSSSPRTFHARAETMRLGAAAPPRLKRSLWQSNLPSGSAYGPIQNT